MSVAAAALVHRVLAPLQRGRFAQPRHGRAGVRVRDGHAQRISRIGAGEAGQLQQAAHHLLHLGLGGAAMASRMTEPGFRRVFRFAVGALLILAALLILTRG